MKRFLLIIITITLISGGFRIFSKYLDVGSDPTKIKILTTQEIISPSEYEFGHFSPDGEYFFMHYDSETIVKSTIYLKNGQVLKETNLLLQYWIDDSKNLLAVDKEYKIWIYNLKTNQKKFIPLEYDSTISLVYNPYNNKFLYMKKDTDEVYEYDIDSLSSTFVCNIVERNTGIFPISKDKVIFVQRVKSESGNENSLYKYDLRTSEKIEISKVGLSYPTFFIKSYLKSNNFLFERDGYMFIIDSNGKSVSKGIKLRYWDTENDIDSSSLNFLFNSVSPNGKLIAITSVSKFQDDIRNELVRNSEIEIISLSGHLSTLTDTKDIFEFVIEWSPSGDRIVFLDKKIDKYYLCKLSIQ